ncbi:MAG: class IV adenylate cyclase [Anaerolineales bacterium]
MQETEAKFYVQDLGRIKAQLEQLDARLIQDRLLETNIRYDLPDASLLAEGRVIRLRRDTQVRLTYKSAGNADQGVLSREEIEFVVEDFDKAKRFLEALGYQKLVYYEKYRATYELNETLVLLDELPYGNFIEIEGKTPQVIRMVADRLKLNWDTAVAMSYHTLFERLRTRLGLPFQDLSFANFAGLNVKTVDLGVDAADS